MISENNNNEIQIQQLITNWTNALCLKDINQMMSNYADDVIIFDIKPPFQTKGAIEWRRMWEKCLPYFPESFQIETRDIIIHVSDNIAFAHWLWRFTEVPENHRILKTWMRATMGYRKQNEQWLIVHEHASLPFNPETSQVVFTSDP
ncbi:unnamed protein product [Rotaria sordida]|uniref:SnoaL-like domain-containing protein n=1 Tax=Rotaria sordida TaxID=392033 RepID=A0A819EUB2_9BILA|nr:unnamed protein product [Rotaria sordida]CAF1209103.1 unnamed protein product [Rotaria sordida]CAF3735864.1 unnamed protein product [Rotaria sordida]CAF3856526.1 unnamed protein product [Rotaria sordida]